MKPLSKLCDAADWYDPEFERIVSAELEDPPRFHRKQWEFAQIFRSLQTLGYLDGRSAGLSMGGGRERLLYAVARRVGHLTVTDLYEAASAWDESRIDDPDRAIKTSAPFHVDPGHLRALRMDMRQLDFPDAAFDFCYSSCAIEHIGHFDDFRRHLEEVRRVLKDDGVYVLTTEFHYGDEVVPAPHNYYFSAQFLDELVRAASFGAIGGVDGAIWRHRLNRPLPKNLADLCADSASGVTGMLVDAAPHLQLLDGGLPFTSMSLVLGKTRRGVAAGVAPPQGLAESRRFIEAGVDRWRTFIEGAELRLDPFSRLDEPRPSGATPRHVATHGTVFHTGYVWLGNATRPVVVRADVSVDRGARIDFRIHRETTRDPGRVSCAANRVLSVPASGPINVALALDAQEPHAYAVLAKVIEGTCRAGGIEIRVGAASGAASQGSGETQV